MQIEFLPSATKLRRLCFYTCLSSCSQWGGGCLPQCWDTTSVILFTVGGGVCLSAGIPPPRKHTHPPEASPGKHTPRKQTPPPPKHTPPRSRHPPGMQNPPGSRHTPPGRRPPLQMVRIILECILVHSAFN